MLQKSAFFRKGVGNFSFCCLEWYLNMLHNLTLLPMLMYTCELERKARFLFVHFQLLFLDLHLFAYLFLLHLHLRNGGELRAGGANDMFFSHLVHNYNCLFYTVHLFHFFYLHFFLPPLIKMNTLRWGQTNFFTTLPTIFEPLFMIFASSNNISFHFWNGVSWGKIIISPTLCRTISKSEFTFFQTSFSSPSYIFKSIGVQEGEGDIDYFQ